ncbi:membrane protein [Streptococcus acidominimus]|uniref:Membrane protein n=1 Tax=Streptococcus acidominimus TaxID=1326 RepID=A0A239XFC8_STRAI|nr:hypothetical protein [Streptococcus acidominimus]SNV44658.1 membrane protein [Streptococcus acidominimus]
MQKQLHVLVWLIMMIVWYWVYLPPLSVFSQSFWVFLVVGIWLGWFLSYLPKIAKADWLKGTGGGFKKSQNGMRFASAPLLKFSTFWKWLLLGTVGVFLAIFLLNVSQSRLFRAKSYANVISVKNASFEKDFPETDLSTLALLDRKSAKKIGDTYLGTIDKVSQFGISDAYRQITIGNQPYRVSPLEYKSFWKWLSNRKEGIDYYVKVNQTTGKAQLVRLDEGMHYSDSEFLFRDTKRHLRLQFPTKIFGDPSFEVDDDGHPYYVATTFRPRFGLMSNDPNGAVLMDAITGKSQFYALEDIPKWVDRVYSAENVMMRVDDHYTYQDGFLNTLFSQTGIKATTDLYNYIAIDGDIYLYTGITSVTADSSNLGFILVNMRTRQVTNYKLASATEAAAQASAEGEVQEKKYQATAPTLVKLDDKAFYLVSLKDDAGLVKSYALVDAEDYQQVTVNNDMVALLSQFTDVDTDQLSQLGSGKKVIIISGQVDALASQNISGTTVYYVSSNDIIYKIKASSKTLDDLPFLAVGDHFKGELGKDNYLNRVELNLSETGDKKE